MWTVRDIMHRHVVRVRPEATIRELVALLAQEQISGVPVVDERGEIAGVVSATDVLQLAADNIETPVGGLAVRPRRRDDEDEESASFFRAMDSPFGFSEPDPRALGVPELAEYKVEDIMTPAAFSVDSDMTVSDLARFLLDRRIHRALVVDRGQLTGIVTSFDVLRAAADSSFTPSGTELLC
jgi:CBS domain-containing protein